MVYLLDRAIGYNTHAGQATGIIYDASNGSALNGVIVDIEEHSASILKPRLTNEFGRYRRILNAGTYHMNIHKKGYISQSHTVVANNSGISTNDYYLEPAPFRSLQLDLEYTSLPDIVECFIISEFDTDSLILDSDNNDLSLHEGNYTVIVNPTGGTPWEKAITLDRDISFTIPIDHSSSYLLSHDWSNWNTQNDNWSIEDGILLSQQGMYYENNDSLLGLKWIESDYYDVSGSNRIIFSINHRYETEWDHDSIGIAILDTNNIIIHRHGWSGDNWERYQYNYTSLTNDMGFSIIKVRLWLKTDITVNYRGWEIGQLWMHAVDDNYLDTEDILSNNPPQINFGIRGVFPNPSYGSLRLDIRSWQGNPAKVKVYNILGQELMSKSIDISSKGDFFLDLDFTELTKGLVSSGMLFIAIESNYHKVVRKCIMLKN
jgi:hypothetical protein